MKKFLVILLSAIMLLPIGVFAEEETIREEHNNNLKELTIEGYEIDFDKYKKIYSVEVGSTVNNLEITALPEATSSNVLIKGADNLTQNDNKVTIEVTSTDKQTKTYVINVTKSKDVVKNEIGNKFKIDDKYIDYAIYFTIAAVGIALIVFIIVRVRDRKIEKGINKL